MSGEDSKGKKGVEELKAKQILSEFDGRLTLVERMTARLRPLRPPVCTSRRLFDYFELPDPYHPIDYNKPYKPDIGPSKLILGENRRPVAPHAKVPELKPRIESDKGKAPQAFRPQGVPSAATREPSRTAPSPRPTPKSVQPKPNQKPEFGQQSGHAVTKLPVRPDIGDLSGVNPNKNAGSASSVQPKINRSIPKPPSKTQKSRTGNMRMRRSAITNSKPVVKPLHPPSKPQQRPVVDMPSPESSINRSPNAASGSGGLDDLFGFGNPEGRMRIPKATKTTTSTPTTTQTNATVPEKSTTQIQPESAKPMPPKKATPPKPINRSPNAASGSGGLDDLFGFGNPEGRMRLPKAKTANEQSKKPRPIFDKNPVQKPSDESSKPKN